VREKGGVPMTTSEADGLTIERIDNYGAHRGDPRSVCFEKALG
jgi:hypothetical protein